MTDPITLLTEIDSLKAEEASLRHQRQLLSHQVADLSISIQALETKRLLLERQNLISSRGITHCPSTKTPRALRLITPRHQKPTATLTDAIASLSPEALATALAKKLGPNWRNLLNLSE